MMRRGEFAPGEVLYNAVKARRGILEKVIVKSVRSVANRRTLATSRVLYVDTFNGLWNERDLVTPDEALALVVAHVQRLDDDAEAMAARCQPEHFSVWRVLIPLPTS